MKKLNRKQLIKIGIIALSTLLAIYIITRFGHIITGPRIKIDSPGKETITTSSVTLSGTVKGGKLFWINGVQMPIEKDGNFNQLITVPIGYTVMTLEAQDELGSKRTKRISVYYLPPTQAEEQIQPETTIEPEEEEEESQSTEQTTISE